MSKEYIQVRSDAVDWLKTHYPALCEKSGLCERVGGRLYTRSTLQSASDIGGSGLTPMEQLIAFVDWERKQRPDKLHTAEWARDEIYRLHAEIERLQGAVPVELSDDDLADLYWNRGCHLHTPGTEKQHTALIAFGRTAVAKTSGGAA